MIVKLLQVMHYPPDGSDWQRQLTGNSRMQPRSRPLFVGSTATSGLIFGFTPLMPLKVSRLSYGFCIMGGRGEYSLLLWKDGDETRYVDEKAAAMGRFAFGKATRVRFKGKELVQ